MALTNEHLVALTSEHLVALTNEHLVALTNEHLVALTNEHLVALTNEHLVALTNEHLVALTSEHLVALTNEHLVALTSEDLVALTREHLVALTREHGAQTAVRRLPCEGPPLLLPPMTPLLLLLLLLLLLHLFMNRCAAFAGVDGVAGAADALIGGYLVELDLPAMGEAGVTVEQLVGTLKAALSFVAPTAWQVKSRGREPRVWQGAPSTHQAGWARVRAGWACWCCGLGHGEAVVSMRRKELHWSVQGGAAVGGHVCRRERQWVDGCTERGGRGHAQR